MNRIVLTTGLVVSCFGAAELRSQASPVDWPALAREQQALQEAAMPPAAVVAEAAPPPPSAETARQPGAPAQPPTRAERDSAARRERRKARFEEVIGAAIEAGIAAVAGLR